MKNKFLQIKKLNKNDRVAFGIVGITFLFFPIVMMVMLKTPLGSFFHCVFYKITGKPCAFCGMTRSLEQCFRLNFLQAIRWHLFGPFFFVMYIILIIKYLGGFLSSYSLELKFANSKTKNRLFYLFAALVLFYWILRLFNVTGCEFPPQ